MEKAIMAKKVGMTRIFDDSGRSIPVTVLEAGPCTVISKKTPEKDGYTAIQVGFQREKENRLNKPIKGHLEKAGVGPVKYIREFKLSDVGAYEIGQDIKADIFNSGDYVDVFLGAKASPGPLNVTGMHGDPCLTALDITADRAR